MRSPLDRSRTTLTPTRERSVHYAWIVAAVVFLTMLGAAGIRSAPGVLMVPLENDFGWTRATVSLAVSVNLVLFGLMGPFAAALVDRFGARRIVLTSLALLAVGVSLTTRMREPWQLVLLWGVLVGTGTGMMALATAATVVNHWFTERRGLVMGLLTASNATGQLIFLPIMAYVAEHAGWRATVALVAMGAAVMIPVVFLWMRNRPADVGLRPYGESTAAPGAMSPARGNPLVTTLRVLATGIRSRDFWLLFATFFICGLSTNGLIGTHLIPACMDAGIKEVHAAGMLAAMGVFDLAGTTLSGWLSDRWNNRSLLFWYYALRGLSLMYLPFALDQVFFAGLSIFAVFYGLDWIATVPPTVRLTTDAFGKEDGGIMFGWIVAGHQIGAATAALGAGTLRTVLGTYEQAFLMAGALCLLAALLALRIGPHPRRQRQPAPRGTSTWPVTTS
jgi:predicted MFS family arabinose efflux permease